ncbi:MAG: hypothetical protein RLZZ59_564 [Pseudomonadota bacterium]|jgi:opacity protein-like surface antigen
MKKHLLATTLACAISTSVLAAGDLATPLDSQIYIRADGVVGKYRNVKNSVDAFSQSYNVVSKAKVNSAIEFGVGYNFTDKARLELVAIRPLGTRYNVVSNFTKVEHNNATVLQFAKDFNTSDADQKVLTNQKMTATSDIAITNKIKTNIKALMIRGCYDVIDIGGAQVFLTAGVGGSKVSYKRSRTISLNNLALNANFVRFSNDHIVTTTDTKTRTKNNVAWSVGAGLSYEVYDGVRAEVAYRYINFGKTRNLIDSKDQKIQGTILDLGAHTASFGLRVSL